MIIFIGSVIAAVTAVAGGLKADHDKKKEEKKIEKERQRQEQERKKNADLQAQKEQLDKEKELGKLAIDTERMSKGGGGNIFQIGKGGTGGQLR
ncbi:MAG: hypothetical protein ACRDCE_00890 [Cetobacterium sp.]|uniref:hypothetical protein n=1 Tax=Cetobacterium sp. TaxID=2071632 RepID=UPI003EE51DD5